MLSIDNLHAGCEGKTILQGINLDVNCLLYTSDAADED